MYSGDLQEIKLFHRRQGGMHFLKSQRYKLHQNVVRNTYFNNPFSFNDQVRWLQVYLLFE